MDGLSEQVKTSIANEVTETTQQVLSERRLRTLRELATSIYEAQTAEDACRIAAEVLAKNTADIPFARLYLLDSDGKQARLVSSSGFMDGTSISPSLVDLSLSEELDGAWPLAQVVRTGQAALVTNASILPTSEDAIEDAINRVPTRQSALVLPITRPGQKEPYGLLVAGASPLLQLEDNYRGFFTLIASQIAATIANVRAYEEHARLYQNAQDAIRLRDELFSIVSHDLKNPVATVKGFAQLLKRMVSRINFPDKAQQEQLVDGLSRIDLTATRMTALINELLDIAHFQTGKPLNLDLRETDLVRLAHQAIISYQQTTERHKFNIEIGEPELVGWWDSVRLERVLGNLLSNAIKYSPDGGNIIVRVTKENDEWAVLSVEDQGVGIPNDDLPHIFDRFHRAANVAGQIKGSGIGLASARHIIEQHSGSITVTSHEGKGSTFTVRLPLSMPDEDANA